jgi:hypothetical protein
MGRFIHDANSLDLIEHVRIIISFSELQATWMIKTHYLTEELMIFGLRFDQRIFSG